MCCNKLPKMFGDLKIVLLKLGCTWEHRYGVEWGGETLKKLFMLGFYPQIFDLIGRGEAGAD